MAQIAVHRAQIANAEDAKTRIAVHRAQIENAEDTRTRRYVKFAPTSAEGQTEIKSAAAVAFERAAAAESERDALQAEIAELVAKRNELRVAAESDRDAYQQEIAGLLAKRAQLLEQPSTLETVGEKRVEDLEATYREQAARAAAAEAERDALKRQVAELEARIARTGEKLPGLGAGKDGSDRAAAAAAAVRDELSRQNAEMRARIVAVEFERSAAQQQLAQLRARHAELEEQLRLVESERDVCRAELANVEARQDDGVGDMENAKALRADNAPITPVSQDIKDYLEEVSAVLEEEQNNLFEAEDHWAPGGVMKDVRKNLCILRRRNDAMRGRVFSS